MLFKILVSFLFILNIHAEAIDDSLKHYVDFFNLRPIPNQNKIENQALYDLGKKLFITPLLSGNKDISCLTCHNPKFGTSDGKRLSQSHDGKSVLKRNSQQLFNVGLSSRVHMFWDGRVSYNPTTKTFQTPQNEFNGENPARNDISSVMTSALSMQAIFPIASSEEMKGEVGQNEIANAQDNLVAYNLIMIRLLNHPLFRDDFKKAFPTSQNYNIGHVGEALAHFMRYDFFSNGSPFNQYLNGNNEALTKRQKLGMLVFIENGKCIACHQGSELGLNTFYASVGVPQYGKDQNNLDEGRFDAVKTSNTNKYLFRTPSLLNLKVTAPYFHNGAYQTIREVINHYSNIKEQLPLFQISPESREKLPVDVFIKNDESSIKAIYTSILAPFLKRGLNFSEDEKDALEDFLTNALMDPKFENLY